VGSGQSAVISRLIGLIRQERSDANFQLPDSDFL